MTTQNGRFFLLAAMALLGAMLYGAWVKENPSEERMAGTHQKEETQYASNVDKDIPQISESPSAQSEIKSAVVNTQPIHVKTDVIDLHIDKTGGDIVRLVLLKYAESASNPKQGFVLLDNSDQRYYIAQSGLAGEEGPDIRGVGRAVFKTQASEYTLNNDQNELIVDLTTTTKNQSEVTKRFIFKRGSYLIEVQYLVNNRGTSNYQGSFYARLKRKTPPEESGGYFLGAQTFTGAALYTPDTPFKKISFKDMDDKPVEKTVQGGFAAMVEHYFVSAWVPEKTITSAYEARKTDGDFYSVGLVEPSVVVAPGTEKKISNTLYAGPEIVENLGNLSPGLELSVDYGILWPICQPIFWLLKKMFLLTNNWGGAIILTTILIKLLFYKLSASSYRSMGNMRKLQPRMEALKERYGDDRQKMSQAVMEMYKKEKINPLGGCLPVLIQIPVFIALYYVLLGSVELREAPFIFWIHDLSVKDPFYVLPILMGVSMVIQQRLNPTPADPVQAKVMMFMPIVFTALFLNFPSGLVLYWFVNNVLSIAQQWFITRSIDAGSKLKPHGAK